MTSVGGRLHLSEDAGASSASEFTSSAAAGARPGSAWHRLGIGALDLRETLDGGQAFRWFAAGSGSYEGVVGNTLVRVRNGDSGGDAGVEVAMVGGSTTRADFVSIRDYIASGQDPDLMLRAFAEEPWVGHVSSERLPLRVLRQEPWECLASFVLSQNSNMVRIKKMVGALAEFGDDLHGGGGNRKFPTPSEVADIGAGQLRTLGLGYRAPSLMAVAKHVASSGDWLRDLREATYADAKSELMELPGVGPKVADCVLAYGLDKREAFPIDVHVMRAMTRLYDVAAGAKPDDVAAWARDRFGQWSSLVQLYVFRDEVNRRAGGAGC